MIFTDKSGTQASENMNPYYNDVAGKASGILSSIGTAAQFGVEMKDQISQYSDMSFKEANTLIDGVPSYGGVSALNKKVGAIDVDEAGKGLIGKGVIAGAQMGASVGALGTPMGSLIGAGVGAAVGLGTGVFGKKKAENEANEAMQRGQRKVMTAQTQYNDDVEDYYGGIDANRQQSQQERNYQNRLTSVNVNDPFASIL